MIWERWLALGIPLAIGAIVLVITWRWRVGSLRNAASRIILGNPQATPLALGWALLPGTAGAFSGTFAPGVLLLRDRQVEVEWLHQGHRTGGRVRALADALVASPIRKDNAAYLRLLVEGEQVLFAPADGALFFNQRALAKRVLAEVLQRLRGGPLPPPARGHGGRSS